MNSLVIALIVCLVLIIGLVGYSLCVIGARADRQSEATMQSLKPGLDSGEFIPAEEWNKQGTPASDMVHRGAPPQTHLSRLYPSARAAMGRRA